MLASIFKKPLLVLLAKAWDERLFPKETYKLQSNDPHNKFKRKLSECGHLEDMTFLVASLILSLL